MLAWLAVWLGVQDQIRRNEFAWLLQHDIAELHKEGTLPPRFCGLARGSMRRNITRSRLLGKRRRQAADAGEATEAQATAASARDEEQEEFYSQLALAPESEREAAELSERGKRDLLQRWLKRKLYEEIQEQAFAFARGLREVVPPGVLALFSPIELQALLGGGTNVSNAALADWKKHTEYDNGLDKDDEQVGWFWAAVAAKTPAARADVWRYATARNQPPPLHEGGCGGLDPKFNIVGRSIDKIDDGALISAATCHRQLQLPRYSSAKITARQLERSVQEGLSAMQDSDSFEAGQRRLMSKVQEEMMATAASKGGDAAVQATMRKLFPNSFMCRRCELVRAYVRFCACVCVRVSLFACMCTCMCELVYRTTMILSIRVGANAGAPSDLLTIPSAPTSALTMARRGAVAPASQMPVRSVGGSAPALQIGHPG